MQQRTFTAKQLAEIIGILIAALFVGWVIYYYSIVRYHFNQKKKVLFFQEARYAMIQIENNIHKLTLFGVPHSTLFFAVRPFHNSGYIPNEMFVKLWSPKVEDSFKSDPPTSLLSWRNGNILRNTCIVVLQNPQYDAKNHKMQYEINYLSHDCKARPGMRLKDGELFVDSTEFGGFGM